MSNNTHMYMHVALLMLSTCICLLTSDIMYMYTDTYMSKDSLQVQGEHSIPSLIHKVLILSFYTCLLSRNYTYSRYTI